jgi:RimJ/RimL family protein N-acetyltransferase
VDPQDGQDVTAGSGDIRICGSRLVLRALRPGEIDEEWRAMVTADPMAIAELPDEASFKTRLQRSGRLDDGWLDLAIDVGGVSIGRIQTFVPPGRPLPPGTFEVGIGLRESARGKGYGREALALLTDWLFGHAAAEAVEAPTDPANAAMRTVFQRAGWLLAGSLTEFGREWVLYRITRREWEARRDIVLYTSGCSGAGPTVAPRSGHSVAPGAVSARGPVASVGRGNALANEVPGSPI